MTKTRVTLILLVLLVIATPLNTAVVHAQATEPPTPLSPPTIDTGITYSDAAELVVLGVIVLAIALLAVVYLLNVALAPRE